MNRKQFLTYTAAQVAAWVAAPRELVPQFSRLMFSPAVPPAQRDVLVVIFQRGAMDGLNAVVPYGDPGYYANRPTLRVDPPQAGNDKTAIDLDGFFGLNPALRPLKQIWDDGALAIVDACGSPDPSHSHFEAQDYMERGTPGDHQVPTGWLARHLQTEASPNSSPFRAVGIGAMLPASLRGPVSATALESIAGFHLGGNNPSPQIARFQADLEQVYAGPGTLEAAAALTFDSMKTLAKVNSTRYVPEGGASYPAGSYSMGLEQIAQLIKADVGLEAATLDIGGWDTHILEGAIEGRMPKLMTEFASGLWAFYQDLGDRFSRVTVVTMSEFGRRVAENGNAGTDHGHGNVMFVLSGNLAASKVYGQWPGLAADQLVAPGDLAVSTDFRDVLGEIVQKRLANPDLADVFPGYSEMKFVGLFGG
jgi:uncharacterized protein (DUF1501 family)